MEFSPSQHRQPIAVDLDAVARLILDTQRENGEIPWFPGEKTDPWDHVEAAMGLSVAGRLADAKAAFAWLAQNQLPDGSWYAAYLNGTPSDRTRDTNLSSYLAVGLLHYYLITEDIAFLEEMWLVMQRAIDFALRQQAAGGEIYWALNPQGAVDPMALLTGSSSVYMSLKCALLIARRLGREKPNWHQGLQRLGHAIRNKPYLFNMTKARFSMDWFYPVLAGAVTGQEAHNRIQKLWKKFVVKGQGVRCVSDQPWITLAETSELSLALSAMGNRDLAEIVFNWMNDKLFEDNTYWCGFTYPDMVVWPEEKFTWTNAVVLMAADALYELTPAGNLFSHRFWESHNLLV